MKNNQNVEIFVNEIYVGVRQIKEDDSQLVEFFEELSEKNNYISYLIPNLEMVNSFELNGRLGERIKVAEGVAELKEKFLYYDEDESPEDNLYYAWELVA